MPARRLSRQPELFPLKPVPPPTPYHHVCPACLIDVVCADDLCQLFIPGRLWCCPPCREDLEAALDAQAAGLGDGPPDPVDEALREKDRR